MNKGNKYSLDDIMEFALDNKYSTTVCGNKIKGGQFIVLHYKKYYNVISFMLTDITCKSLNYECIYNESD